MQKFKKNEQSITTTETISNDNCITEKDLFYLINSCPFFQTYNDGEVGLYEGLLSDFLRRFFLNLQTEQYVVSYTETLVKLNDYLINVKNVRNKKVIRSCIVYFNNFYYLFHISKKYKVILPYFPYRLKHIIGCSDAIIETKAGIRMCIFDYNADAVNGESLNYNGFRLQLAARAFYNYTGIQPSSLVCCYLYSKTAVYYSYKHDEEYENILLNPSDCIRKYGSHCAYCMNRNCTPLIDRYDLYGWKHVEGIWNNKTKLFRMKKYRNYSEVLNEKKS